MPAEAAKNFLLVQEKFSRFSPRCCLSSAGEKPENLKNEISRFLRLSERYTKTPGKERNLKHPVYFKKRAAQFGLCCRDS